MLLLKFPIWPSASPMWPASESFIQTGTYWFVMRERNVRKTSRDMIVPTVEATPSSFHCRRRRRWRRKGGHPWPEVIRSAAHPERRYIIIFVTLFAGENNSLARLLLSGNGRSVLRTRSRPRIPLAG